MVVNYQFGKIYKIWSPSQDLQYIGSTAQELSQRLAGHKKNFKCFNNPENKFNKYCASYEVLKFEDYRIDLLENYSCSSKSDLNKREGEYIKNNICVNKYIPGRTKKEHYQDNRDKIKKYYNDNRDKILIQCKEYREDNRDKIKKYRQDNKDKILEKAKVKISCDCGSVVNASVKSRHYKSLKHQNYIKKINI